jgi:WD40 repeat protein
VHAIATWTDPQGNTLLVSAGDDRMVHFWHHGNITHRSSWQCPEPFRTASVFSGPDGTPRIATGGNDLHIRIWDAVDGSLVSGPLSGHERRVRALTTAVGPRGRRVLASASDDGTVRIWDAVTGDALGAPLTGHHGPGTSIVPITNPTDRVRLATGGEDRTVRVWDCFASVLDNDPSMPHAVRVATLAALPLTSAGRDAVAIAGEDGTVAIRDSVTGHEVAAPWLLPNRPVRVLCAVPNAWGTHWLAAGANTDVHVWDPATGTTLPIFTKHTKPVRAITAFIDLDGRCLVATGGHDRQVCLWRPDTGELVAEPIPAYDGCIRAITAFTDRNGELLLAVGGDGTGVRVWHPFAGRSVGKDMNGLTGSVRALVIYRAPDGRRLLAGAGGEGTVATWDLTTREQASPTFTEHTDWITSLVVLRRATGDLLVTGGDDHTVRIWDPVAADSRHVIPIGLPVLSLAPLGDDLAVGTTDGVLVLRWDRSWLDGVHR